MKQLIFSFVALFLMCDTIAQKSSTTDIVKTFDKTIPGLLKETNVPGLAVGIVKNGEVIHLKGYGFSNVDRAMPMTNKTGFNIGSISKTFTAWGIMKLFEEEKIDLDAPASKYLTRWKLPDSDFDSGKVTIRALLNHTAGISVHGYPGFNSAKNLPSIEASLDGENGSVRENEKVEIILEPQTKFQYSGGGYTILQLIIEEVSQMAFADYMDHNIFRPLGMKHTSFNLTPELLKNSATPYDEKGNEMYMVRFTAQAAAGLHTTLDDLVIFWKASFENNPVLQAESLNTLITPTVLANNDYGLGYMVMDRFGFRLIGHAGSNDGWQAGMMFHLESESGIILLTNGSNGKRVAFGALQKWAQWHRNSIE
ncbi:MAG: serine hydrolase domain-containing protein [Bacteroidota bacterium]